MDLYTLIRNIPDFPKPGIQFKDIESLTENPDAFRYVIDQFAIAAIDHEVNKIVALDARGFIFGAALGYKLNLPVVMARKQGKLPGDCVAETYSLEYGEASIELQRTAVEPNDRVLIVDDLIATGGTAAAADSLVKQLGAHVALFAFVIELSDLQGREKLGETAVFSLLQY